MLILMNREDVRSSSLLSTNEGGGGVGRSSRSSSSSARMLLQPGTSLITQPLIRAEAPAASYVCILSRRHEKRSNIVKSDLGVIIYSPADGSGLLISQAMEACV